MNTTKQTQPNFTKSFLDSMSKTEKLYVDKDTQTLLQDLIDARNDDAKLAHKPQRRDSGVECNLDCSAESVRPFNLSAINEELNVINDPIPETKIHDKRELISFRKNSLYSDDLIILEETPEEKREYDLDGSDEDVEKLTTNGTDLIASVNVTGVDFDGVTDLGAKCEEYEHENYSGTGLNVHADDFTLNEDHPIDHTSYRLDSDSLSECSQTGKDSGCDTANDIHDIGDVILPSDELAEQIVTQVEFYFSNANITKDAFLLKHVKRNKEGYVSLKLISSFKRVKHLTKDWRVVANALLNSKKLEINEEGTKVRRIEPLPQYDETAPSRTVVAVNLPLAKPTIENVAELFSPCGEIALIRILRPGNPIPADVRQFMNKNPSLSEVDCALIEFITSEAARNALDFQEMTFDGYADHMKIYQLNNLPPSERKKKLQAKKEPNRRDSLPRRDSDYSSCMSCTSCSESEDSRRFNDPRYRMRRGSSVQYPLRANPDQWMHRRLSAASGTSTTSGSDSPYSVYSPRRLSASSREGSETMIYFARRFSNSSSNSFSSSDYGNGNFRRSSSCSSDSYGSYNPRSRSNSMAMAYHLPENVLRMPQGPDGSKGFRQRCITNPSY